MATDIVAWRREQRARLLAHRQTIAHDDRAEATKRIAAALDRLIAQRKPSAIGFYWPIRLEPNLLDWARAIAAAGGPALCLPVVVTPMVDADSVSQRDTLGKYLVDRLAMLTALGARRIIGEHHALLVVVLLQDRHKTFGLLFDAAIRRAAHEVKNFQRDLVPASARLCISGRRSQGATG